MKKILSVALLVAVLLPLVALAQSGLSIPPNMQQQGVARTQWINILSSEKAAKAGCCITPSGKFWVDRESRLVWNNTSGADVRIKFGIGTKCQEVNEKTLAQNDLRMALGCYITEPIPSGKTLWMRFSDPGQYDYTIEYSGDRAPESGTIGVF